MEFFKQMESLDRRNKTCRSSLLKRKSITTTAVVPSHSLLNTSLTYEEETPDNDENAEKFTVTLRQVVERKLALYKVLYPFLPADQVKGKVISSLGLHKHLSSDGSDLLAKTNLTSVNPLMMRDYNAYIAQTLTSLNHTQGPLKVVYDYMPRTEVTAVVEQQDSPQRVEELPQSDVTESPVAEQVQKDLTPIKPLSEWNIKSITPFQRTVQRKTPFIIRSEAPTSENRSEVESLIFAPGTRPRRVAGKILQSTPMVRLPVKTVSTSESSIESICKGKVLPPTPPRRPMAPRNSGLMLPPMVPAGRTLRPRPGTPMAQAPPSPTSGSERTGKDSLIMMTRFRTVTRSPPPKKARYNHEAVKALFQTPTIASESQYDYEDEENMDQFGLPVTDYMTKVTQFLFTAEPDENVEQD